MGMVDIRDFNGFSGMQQSSSTRYLLLILVIGISCLYIQYYTSYVKTFQLLQSSLDTITIDTVYERQPIIIQDRIVDPLQLTKTLFKWNYMFHTMTHIDARSDARSDAHHDTTKIIKTNHKYTILYAPTMDIHLQLIHPKFHSDIKPFVHTSLSNGGGYIVTSAVSLQDSRVEYVTVKLKKQQCIIIPMLWLYQTHDTYDIITLDDPLSYCIGRMY